MRMERRSNPAAELPSGKRGSISLRCAITRVHKVALRALIL
jgi:hypothetical protein